MVGEWPAWQATSMTVRPSAKRSDKRDDHVFMAVMVASTVSFFVVTLDNAPRVRKRTPILATLATPFAAKES